MTVVRHVPVAGVWRRPGLRPVDLLVFAALLALLFGLLRLAPALNAPFLPRTAPSTVSTDPANLPYYAVRSLLRMFIGLILSVLFTFVYATAAARLRRAEKVLIPVLDILQSVPVLGFLTVTVTAFINLFPGSELGLEFAAVFAIFTSMAWRGGGGGVDVSAEVVGASATGSLPTSSTRTSTGCLTAQRFRSAWGPRARRSG